MRDEEIKSLNQAACVAKIAELQAKAAPKIRDLAKLNYNEARELEVSYLQPIEKIQRRLSALKGAEKAAATRRWRKEHGA